MILATGAHNFVIEVERQAPNCIENGYVIWACGCGTAEYTEILFANGAHVYGNRVVENLIEATHDTDGSFDEVIYCENCGEELYRETIIVPMGKHNWMSIVVDATCTKWGFTLHLCADDGCTASYADSYVHTLGHAFSEATCTEAATCERCGETEGELAAHNITSSSEGFEASCLEEGIVEYYYCGDCNTYFADAECTVKMEDQTGLGLNIPMTGHNITSSCEGFEASCLEEGMLEYYYCGDCNTYFADAELTTELEDQTGANLVIPMTGHNITVSCEGFAATCTEEGMLEYYYCGDCNTYFADAELTTKLEDQTGKNLTIAVGAHTEGEWVVVKEAAIGVDGLKELRCTVCGEVLATEVIPALENSPETGSVMFFVVAAFGVVAMIGATVVIGKKKYF